MTPENENKKKLESFFKDEYQSMRAYVDSRIRATTDRDAEDILQDVAANLFSGVSRNSPINNVAGFVYRSIRNKIIDVMRKGKNTSNPDDEIGESLAQVNNNHEEAANTYTERMKHELEHAIANLKPPYRDIIVAIDIEGYSYREISIETGIPEGTLMSRRHRAVAQLLVELEKKKELFN